MGLLARILKKKVAQTVAGFQKKNQRIDLDWPLKIRLGSTIRFDASLFILAGDDLKMAVPASDCVVAAAGSYLLGHSKYYTFYVKDTEDVEWFLQLGLERSMAVGSAMLYQTIDEAYPETAEDWDLWLNEETGLIGFKDFQTPDGMTYQRLWKQEGPDYAAPWCYDESVTDDPFVPSSFNISHHAMLYGRSIRRAQGFRAGGESVVENLLADKIEDDDGACIQISAGIEVPIMSLTIL